MCFHTSLAADIPALEARFNATMPASSGFTPAYHINAYSFPGYPILTHQQPAQFQSIRWGLIPHWVKSKADADKLRAQTINARSETIYEKPSYRQAAKRAQRCIIPVTGFFEWYTDAGKQKYPFYLTTDQPITSIAGLWDEWADPETGEVLTTFSLLTTDANSLLAAVHNEKKRMPCVLTPDAERTWLHDDLTERDVLHLLSTTYPAQQMHSQSISKRITSRTEDTNVPDVLRPVTYPELTEKKELFA
ncbi:SOS response-associated peptidase [uncultured Fibrella sp.]|uniref:SOS response-associated peptidase n=1 Tax=uncultured Fibrella sp. TaxID=1284596 RepID=UPI0035CABC39